MYIDFYTGRRRMVRTTFDIGRMRETKDKKRLDICQHLKQSRAFPEKAFGKHSATKIDQRHHFQRRIILDINCTTTIAETTHHARCANSRRTIPKRSVANDKAKRSS
jgi:hypothetical protein